MNWFERYGIPGTYFYIVLLAGLYAVYPCKMENIDMRALATFAVSFLPVGYVICIFAQWYYLRSSKGGLLSRAVAELTKLEISAVHDVIKEPELEALGCLHAATYKDTPTDPAHKSISLDSHKFIQAWITKRMDVIAINHSLQFATYSAALLSIVLGFAIWGCNWQPNSMLIALLLLILLLIWFIVGETNMVLEKQVAKLIADYWKASDFKCPPLDKK